MPKRNLIWIAAIIVAAAVVVWVTGRPPGPAGRAKPGEFDAVADAYCLIKDRYFKATDGAELRSGAVRGMVANLDEFSSYVPPDELEAFSHRIMGMDRGLGLRLESDAGRITVVGPLANSPAHKAGILGGDVLLAIDGRAIDGLSLARVERMLAGPLGREVKLTIQRRAGPRRTLTVTRAEFPIESVQGLSRDPAGKWVYMVRPDDGLVYVRVREFVNGTGARLRDVLTRLGSLRGVLLDLRANPGGMLPEAVASANIFLRRGVIATSVARGREPVKYCAVAAGTLGDFPMVVLIDGRTASAAEILAGALKLHDRAVLVGTRTRGKGYVQTMYRLPGRLGQINLTTSEFLIGRTVPVSRMPGSETWGVDPHPGMVVPLAGPVQAALKKLRIRAEVLPSPPGEPSTRSSTQAGPIADELVRIDGQLAEALDLLAQPERVDEILRRAAAERARRQALTTRRATEEDE